jgi:hypothetical protein
LLTCINATASASVHNRSKTDQHDHSPEGTINAAYPRACAPNFGDHGGIDGTPTFAIVAGVQGAGLSPTIIALGIATIIADGFAGRQQLFGQ